MKNKDILDMILQLKRAYEGLREISTEGGQTPFMSVEMGAVQIDERAMKEFFGDAVSFRPRVSSQYPVEAHAEYKDTEFVSILTAEQANELWGYKAEGGES